MTNSLHTDVRMELTPESVEVREDIGSVILCLNVTAPGPDDPLDIEIFINLETEPGTAGNIRVFSKATELNCVPV